MTMKFLKSISASYARGGACVVCRRRCGTPYLDLGVDDDYDASIVIGSYCRNRIIKMSGAVDKDTAELLKDTAEAYAEILVEAEARRETALSLVRKLQEFDAS